MPEFGSRGTALWTELGQTSEHTPSGVLAVEACRTADRLDSMHNTLQGGGDWLTVIKDDEGEIHLVIDKALSEIRLQAASLKALLESPVLKVSETGKADPVDDLASARKARLAAAQGSLGS